VTIRSTVPGLSTLTATYEGSAGGGDFDNPVEFADYIDSGDKLWVDYLLEVSDDAINALDDPHVFTYTLRQSTEEDVWTPAAGEDLTFALSGAGTITAVSAARSPRTPVAPPARPTATASARSPSCRASPARPR
jgi:hypothetical protein